MRKNGWVHWGVSIGLATLLAAGGCQPAGETTLQDEMPELTAVALSNGERLRVVATTSIVGDVVQQVGGEWIELTVLIPRGVDPHAYEPTPQDAAALADADVIFVNGARLEAFMEPLLTSTGQEVAVVPVSAGIELRLLDEGHGGEAADEHEHAGEADPHVWFDPMNVVTWTRNVESVLGTLDPGNAAAYTANAAAYEEQLRALDDWIRRQVNEVPAGERRLVTDHASFDYFAARYGFEPLGMIFPGISTLAQPSAQERADLEHTIRAQGIRAIFVGRTVNPELAGQIAEDTGTQLVVLYTGSLSESGGPADSYLDMMRYDVTAIVEALR